MNFERMIEIVGYEPVFETGLLLAGAANAKGVQRQLSRWTRAGRIHQLRRGLYALAPPFRKVQPHPFLVANRLVSASYVSCQSALAFYGLIPEHVPRVTSVTTARPGCWDTPLGSYVFQHVKADLLWGYVLMEVGPEQSAFVAKPEKALLDLIYLQAEGDSPRYLQGLRLQHLENLDLDELQRQAERSDSPKLRRAARRVAELALRERLEYETL